MNIYPSMTKDFASINHCPPITHTHCSLIRVCYRSSRRAVDPATFGNEENPPRLALSLSQTHTHQLSVSPEENTLLSCDNDAAGLFPTIFSFSSTLHHFH